MNELALFAGAGGGILGGILCGFRTVCAVEWDAYARDVLVARQNDGCLETFPIWDDVQTFDGRPWRGIVDVVSGGFPCQDISAAGKGAGIEGERSGMWKHMARIVGEVLPQFVLVENSPLLVGRGLGLVLGDLAEMGYDARWGVVGGPSIGAATLRERLWIVAHSVRCRRRDGRTGGPGRWDGGKNEAVGTLRDRGRGESIRLRQDEPGLCGVASRVAHQLDEHRTQRLRAIGNGQIPGVAALAWQILNTENTR
jgi:DNA (cytosine-5)-methyltransferase 1